MPESSPTTRTGGRSATTGYIAGDCALAVGMPPDEPPLGWKWHLLSDLARLETGHTPSRRHPEYWDGDIPWIGIRDATGNHGRTLHDTMQHATQAGIDNSSARILPKNTVCLSRTASVGYVVVMGQAMATSQDFVNWVCDPERLDHRFLKYVLLAEKSSYARFAHGTTHQTIYFPEVKAFHLCAPELNEQKAIADILSHLDDKIELNRRMNRTLEQMAAAIFKAWFVDFEPVRAKASGAASFPGMPQAVFDALPSTFADSELGPIPEGWEVKPFSDCVTIWSGGTPKRSEPTYWGGDVPWYSVKDAPAESDVWIIETSEKITQAGLDGSAAKLLPVGTTIISARGTVGTLALTAVPMAMNQSCYGLEGVDGAGAFLTYWRTRRAVDLLRQRSHGSVFDTITRNTFDGVPIVTTPATVLTAFDAVVSSLMELMQQNGVESRTLAETRDALLPKLLSGEVRVDTIRELATTVETSA